MNSIFGITNIRIKAIEVNQNDLTEVNRFLDNHNGNIINIQTIPLFQGFSRFFITYREESENDDNN